jgi:two-component system, LytTR family, sensor kinase
MRIVKTGLEDINFNPGIVPPKNRRREYIIRFFGIIIVSAISVLVDSPYNYSETGILKSFLVALVRTALIWNGSMLIIEYATTRYSIFKETLKIITFQVIALSVFVLVVELGEIFLIEKYLNVKLTQVAKTSLIIGTFLITFMISSLYAAIAFFIQWKENLLRAQALEKANLEARYETLRNQVNPHFLFNSLNTLLMLVNDNPLASRYVESISEIMRYMLQSRDKEAVLLRDELKIARDYVFIQQSRFGDKLRVEFDVAERFYHFAVAPLAIQMLLENTVKHNVVSRENPLTVKVYIQENNFVVIENTVKARIDRDSSTGVGLDNIRKRYLHLTGKDVVIKQDNGKFTVMLPLFEKSI